MNIIEVNGLTKRYGKTLAVDHLSFQIEEQTIVGFVGKNGAGKTTTIRCMLDFLKPSAGMISIAGKDSVKESHEIKKILGYMPSEISYDHNLSCLHVFQLACRISGLPIKKAYDLTDYFELDVHKKIRDLSLGNRKKVSIIQALLKDVKILVLDEPTSGLDPLMQHKFFSLLADLKKNGVTIFLSSHNLDEIQKYCDRVLIIKNGQLADDLQVDKLNASSRQSVTYMTADKKMHSFLYEGDINELIQKLAKLDLLHLEIKNVSVEEEFIKYYEE